MYAFYAVLVQIPCSQASNGSAFLANHGPDSFFKRAIITHNTAEILEASHCLELCIKLQSKSKVEGQLPRQIGIALLYYKGWW